MTLRKVMGHLEPEDYQRHLQSYAKVQVAMSGHPDVSVEEAEKAIVEDLLLIGELRLKYDIPEDEQVDFSLYDGAICEAAE